jgi:aminoglycoside phosphotransferase (APT) family kinase protein
MSAGATATRVSARFDETALERHLAEHLPGFRGPVTVAQFSGGQSNPSYLLTTCDRRFVLRRKPPGKLLPSAHAVDREFAVTSALAQHSNVPVARPHLLCSDASVIGTEFYVMDYVEGRVFWDTSFPEVSREERPQYFDAMNAVLAELHNVDPVNAGLSWFGRPEGYLPRQLARWSRQYAQDSEVAGRVPAMESMFEWLGEHLPPDDDAAVVHGDFRCDNLIFHPTEPRVVAVIDWELSTLGHPLADFAYHLMMYRMPTLAFPGLRDLDLDALNLPPEHSYIEAYRRRTNREAEVSLEPYIAFSLLRLAGIFHGIRGRLKRGTAASARAAEYARHVEAVAELASRAARSIDHELARS